MAITYLSGERIQGSSVSEIPSEQGDYKILKLITGGTFTPAETFDVEYLVIGGGGGGGATSSGGNAHSSGGGGAGGVLHATGYEVTAQSYTITVGNGGAGATSAASGADGQDSVFGSFTADGGGGGGQYASVGRDGGSGGGSGANGSNPAGSATPGQGNDGGVGEPNSSQAGYGGGGGGGKGSAGQDANTDGTKAGDGGDGYAYSITGSSVLYAGGGGGGGSTPSVGGDAGSGGGGAGTMTSDTSESDATDYTGGGGGGSSAYPAGDGGKGVVFLKFLKSKSYTLGGGATTGSLGTQDDKASLFSDTTLWTQTGGTLFNTHNTNTQGTAILIDTSNANIGDTMTSFTMEIGSSDTGVDCPITFGVWADGNNTKTPTSAFTNSSVDNNNDLTTTATHYTFTGSHVLAEDDRIGMMWSTSTDVIKQQIASNSTQCATNTQLSQWYISNGYWTNNGSNTPNTTAKSLTIDIPLQTQFEETDTRKQYSLLYTTSGGSKGWVEMGTGGFLS